MTCFIRGTNPVKVPVGCRGSSSSGKCPWACFHGVLQVYAATGTSVCEQTSVKPCCAGFPFIPLASVKHVTTYRQSPGKG